MLNNLRNLTLVLGVVACCQYGQASTINHPEYNEISLNKMRTNTISTFENVVPSLSEKTSSTNCLKDSSSNVKDEKKTDIKSNQNSNKNNIVWIDKCDTIDYSCMGKVDKRFDYYNWKVITGKKLMRKTNNIRCPINASNNNLQITKTFEKRSQINQNPDHK